MRNLRVILVGVLVATLCAHAWADEEPAAKTKTIRLEVAEPDAKPQLGDGWSRRQHVNARMARWLTKMEGDVYFDLKEGQEYKIEIIAAPQYLHYRRQNIGLFINKRFVTEWIFPDDPNYSDFEATIPADLVKDGKNTLTFRVGYRRRIRPDPRELGIAVRRITLTPM